MIETSVCFVLLLQDDFNGTNRIDGGHIFTVNEKNVRPVRKQEGYYVFTGLFGNEFTVTIISAKYSTQTIFINTLKLAKDNAVVTVRLYRKPGIYFSDCQWLEGTVKPGLRAAVLSEENPELKLDCIQTGEDEKQRIRFQGYTIKNLCGQVFCIGAGKNREFFVLSEKNADGSYVIDHIVLRFRHKEGEHIYRAYSAICDEKGYFGIPIKIGMKQDVKQIETYDEGENRWDCLCATALK